MAVYVVLFKFTDQGIRDIKNVAELIPGTVQRFEAMGGKILGLYSTMGEYDLVGIGEAPNDEVIMTFLLDLGAAGNVRSTTLKAFPVEKLIELAKKIT
jgi:uncharacterized protein with GYD domain